MAGSPDDEVRVIRKRKPASPVRTKAPPTGLATESSTGFGNGNAMQTLRGPREQVCLTPEWLLGLLGARFGPFDFDPAPYPLPPGFDGLHPDTVWGKCNFVNPPFADLEQWAVRAVHELDARGNTTLLLVPMRPHLRVWHELLAGRFAMYPVMGYVRFRGYADELPYTMAAVWISNDVMPESHYRAAVAILRPIDLMRDARKVDVDGKPAPKGRVTHDIACATYPGALIDRDGTLLFKGPVCAFHPIVGDKASERRRGTKRTPHPDAE